MMADVDPIGRTTGTAFLVGKLDDGDQIGRITVLLNRTLDDFAVVHVVGRIGHIPWITNKSIFLCVAYVGADPVD
jgi:hypothetical protein